MAPPLLKRLSSIWNTYMHNSFIRSCVLAVSLICLSGCGVIDYFYLPPPEDTAQELFETANDYMKEKNYVAAIERYNKLKDAYPFSPYTIDAELSLGDAFFLDGEYTNAAEAYKDFESLHPRHEAIPYVLYQIGMARMKSFISIDRPTTELHEAYSYFDRLIQSYPDSKYVPVAKESMLECRKLMAEHELYIADVFWHMKKYGPAWRRYTYVVNNFKDIPSIVEHAEKKALTAYHSYREEQAKELRQKREGSWKQWFTWL